MSNPNLNTDSSKVDKEFENSIRPREINDFSGQPQLIENLRIFIKAAKIRGEALDHILFHGPPGLGKTTLSHIIANELGAQIKVTSGPAIERAGDLAAILTNLSPNDVLFIDEIHRLNRAVEEILYPAMEDFALDFVIGKGPGARSMRLELPPFTLIGATTRAGMLTGPLRDRFGVICRLEMYKPEELAVIINRSAGILNIKIEKDACGELPRRSRGTPRIANRLLKRVRDFAEVKGEDTVTLETAKSSLKLLDVDELGLDLIDIKVLEAIIKKFGGGPAGLDTVASAINEESVTVEDVVEPFLLQLGFIARTPRGRICLPAAYRHLGVPLTKQQREQLTLFDLGLNDENK